MPTTKPETMNISPSSTTPASALTPSKRRRVAKPATSARAIAAARRRRGELERVLAIRDVEVRRLGLSSPLDRDKLTVEQRQALDSGPYPKAAAAYLATHERWFQQIAHRAQARHVPFEDLVQTAKIGGLRALDKFNASLVESGSVTSFLSYARWWVRCEIGKLFEDESLVKIPAAAKKTATDLRSRIDAEAARLNRNPDSLTDDDVAMLFSMPLEKVKQYRHLHLGHEHPEVQTYGRSRNPEEAISQTLVSQRLAELQAEHEDDVETKQRGGLVDAAYMRLPAKYRRVLGEVYGLELDGEALSVTLPEGDIARRAMLAAALGRLRAVAQRVD
jgi:RNA polymerase sigma factor (sigma-70 family)